MAICPNAQGKSNAPKKIVEIILAWTICQLHRTTAPTFYKKKRYVMRYLSVILAGPRHALCRNKKHPRRRGHPSRPKEGFVGTSVFWGRSRDFGCARIGVMVKDVVSPSLVEGIRARPEDFCQFSQCSELATIFCSIYRMGTRSGKHLTGSEGGPPVFPVQQRIQLSVCIPGHCLWEIENWCVYVSLDREKSRHWFIVNSMYQNKV